MEVTKPVARPGRHQRLLRVTDLCPVTSLSLSVLNNKCQIARCVVTLFIFFLGGVTMGHL